MTDITPLEQRCIDASGLANLAGFQLETHKEEKLVIVRAILAASPLAELRATAAEYLTAHDELSAYPDNDMTKAFDRKLYRVEFAETALRAALAKAGL